MERDVFGVRRSSGVAVACAERKSPVRAQATQSSALAMTSCGRFSPIMRMPASIAAMISPTSRVFVAASSFTEPGGATGR